MRKKQSVSITHWAVHAYPVLASVWVLRSKLFKKKIIRVEVRKKARRKLCHGAISEK